MQPRSTAVSQSARLLAPAKVNLTLRIVGRRPDGYHLLQSLMVPIDLYDEIELAVCDGAATAITIACDAPEVAAGADNLAYRAAETFLRETSTCAQIDIRLHKRIPPASGLGGGSSDAAAMLTALNRLLQTGCDAAELALWALQVGADVPFFVHGRPACVEGIGEQIQPTAGCGGIALVVARPAHGLSTAAIYRRYDELRGANPASLTKKVSATSIADFVGGRIPLRELLANDLEAVAVEVYPELVSLKTLLREVGADGALMSGSGSAVFGVWPSRAAAELAAQTVRERGYWAVAAQTLERSPAAA